MAKVLQLDADGLPVAAASPELGGPLIVPKASGDGGVQVDTTTPTWPWRDLKSPVIVDQGGASAPTFATFRNGIKAWQFGSPGVDEIFQEFHIPHDYVEGTDVYIHAHWSQNVVDTGGAGATPGDAKWFFECIYAKGHNQGAFGAAITAIVVQTASGTQYQHMIAEVQLSAASPTAAQLDTDDLEPDGLILVRVYRDPADAADTLDQDPFMFEVDVHYQSSNIGTKNKVPNFYS